MELNGGTISRALEIQMEQALRGWMGTHGTNPQDYLGMRQKPISILKPHFVL